MIVRSINERIVDEILPQIKVINDNKLKYKQQNEKYGSKLLGNVVATTLRKYIENIIKYYDLEYSVSLNNAFVDYYPIEWDLIICKKGLIPETNVISVNDVVAIFEFKTSGTIDVQYKKRTKHEYLDFTFGKRFEYVKQMEKDSKRRIIFGYITFSTDLSWFEETKEYFNENNQFDNTAFAFIDDNEMEKGNVVGIKGCEDFERYLFGILNVEVNNES